MRPLTQTMRPITFGVLLVCVAFGGSAVGSASPRAMPTTIEVTSEADEIDASPGDGVCTTAVGECTLRAAIQESNDLTGPQTILLPAGEYTLTRSGCCENHADSGDLDITDDTTIIGAGADTTGVSRGETAFVDRIFDVREGATVSISNLSVHGVFMSQIMPEDESCGGGMRNAGNLALAHVIVKDNIFRRNGAGICNEGTLWVQDSVVANNRAAFNGVGGGLLNEPGASAMIRRVSFTLNTAETGPGGGIANFGVLIVVDSLINSNSAVVEPAGGGGGVYNGDVLGASATIINSTIAGNFTDGFSGGGGITNDNEFSSQPATLTVVNSTIADNVASRADGGGLRTSSSSTTSLINTIIAGNDNGDCRSADDSSLPFSRGHNIDSDGSCGLSGPGDVSGADPKLGPFGDNGGPTATYSLRPGSLAIDAGDDGLCPETDQRGAPRPSGAACDIGAYEANAEVPPDPAPGRGDVDCDGVVTLLDAIYLLHHLALGSPFPDCASTPDVNCDGTVDLVDVLLILQQATDAKVAACA